MAKKLKKEQTASKELNPAQQEFVKNYIKCQGRATPAYMMTHPKVKYNVAAVCACRLLKNISVVKAIDEAYKAIWKEKDTEIEKSKTYRLIHSIGDTDISQVIDIEGGTFELKDINNIPVDAIHAIQSIEKIEKETKYGLEKRVSVKLHSKLQALELRAKIQKLVNDKVTVNINYDLESAKEIQRLFNEPIISKKNN